MEIVEESRVLLLGRIHKKVGSADKLSCTGGDLHHLPEVLAPI